MTGMTAVRLLIAAFIAGSAMPNQGLAVPAAIPREPAPLLADLVVNSLDDIAHPETGIVTLRSALSQAVDKQCITFSTALDGGTIRLSILDDAHTVLPGEYMDMVAHPDTGIPISVLLGYYDRDYGKSALYAQKNVVLDASALSQGITITCDASLEARVMAVYGNLTMTGVSITGGKSVASTDLVEPNATTQTATLARGGGLAVWGVARLTDCTIYGNLCDKTLDTNPERDQGAFGGGLFADVVELTDCILSGNSCLGSGVAGGGVFSAGGVAQNTTISWLNRCAITGNSLSSDTAYGAGVYSDGGGIGKSKKLRLTNCTVAWNLVNGTYSPYGYWRGGGIYMSNGYLNLQACTIVDNHVTGYWREDLLGKSSLAGGVAATIGLAHAVESITVEHSILAGNTVQDLTPPGEPAYPQDIFTGTLLHFNSHGYNRIGVIDFSQMLVPVGEPDWWTLCRRHYPELGDVSGVTMAAVLNTVDGLKYSSHILSVGMNPGQPVVLSYEPAGNALDAVPPGPYQVAYTQAEYDVAIGDEDRFLEIFLERVGQYLLGNPLFAAQFTSDFETYLAAHYADRGEPYLDPSGNPIHTIAQIGFFGPSGTWVKEAANFPLILFWHHLDEALRTAAPGLGDELLGDVQWELLFTNGPIEDVLIRIRQVFSSMIRMKQLDQHRAARPVSSPGDVGAIEKSVDLDRDGLDDQWEIDHLGGMSEADGDPGEDPDHDGSSNLHECRAGTHPRDPASVLRIVGARGGAGQTLHWSSVTNRLYAIFKSDNLVGAWPSVPFTNGIPGDVSGTNQFIDPATHGGPIYYRIDAE